MVEKLPHAPFPEPGELWEGCMVKGWTFLQRGQLALVLTGVSSAIIYCEQPVINRVTKYVQGVIDKANAGDFSYERTLELVTKEVVFSEEELAAIKENAKKDGKMMGRFYQNRGTPS
jgi:hypothetical protein